MPAPATTTKRRRPVTARHLPPLPARSPLRAGDIAFATALYLIVVLGMFVRHGGLERAGTLSGSIAAVGQVAALVGTATALAGVLLMSRHPLIEQGVGADRLARFHRWLGFAAVWAVLLHAAASTLAWAGSIGAIPSTVAELAGDGIGGAGALAGGALFAVIGVSSTAGVRRAIGYEAWHLLHLLAYPALLLGFLHQFTMGTDLSSDPVARSVWAGSYTVAFSPLIYHRFLVPVWRSLRHRFRVAAVVAESADVISIHLAGRSLHRLPHRAGQYFSLRFLTADGWFRSHPFSLSAGPDGQTLRFTVKGLGGWTRRLWALRPGTRVIVEGPYGILHGGHRTQERVLLIGGGIGITPLRALFETLPGEVDLLYRVSHERELIFREELDAIARMRGSKVYYLVGRREDLGYDPLGPEAIRRLVPDVTSRDVYLCGPEPMMAGVRRALRSLRVPGSRVHHESFGW
jgi:predicted ferric reductase